MHVKHTPVMSLCISLTSDHRFSKQEYWSEVPTLLQRIFLDPRMEIVSLHPPAGEFFNTSLT